VNFLLVAVLVSHGQFAKGYSGISVQSIIQASDGGFAIAGWTGSTSRNVSMIKLLSSGDASWARTFDGGNWEYVESIIQTSDGGYAMVGATNSSGAGNYDILVIKLDASGIVDWAKTFGGTQAECAYSIIQTSDGGYAVTGYTGSSGAGFDDFFILKLLASGNLDWARTFGGAINDCASSITETTDGGIAVAGYTYSFGIMPPDILVVKLLASGNLDWARTIHVDPAGEDHASSMVGTSDGGIVMAGNTGNQVGLYAFWLVIKLNSSGNREWASAFSWTSLDYCESIIQTSDGGFTVAGYTDNFSDYDPLILKLSSSGGVEWASSYMAGSSEYFFSVTQASDGGYVAAGDYLVLKVDSDGNYPDCVTDRASSPFDVVTPMSSPTGLAIWAPASGDPTLTPGTPSPAATDVCPPAVEETETHGPGITCSLVPGGALFISRGETGIRIYSPDGRLVHSGNLAAGQNRIGLETGVYFWKAGTCKGKVVVR
jgi:hypothetical protein